MKIQKINIITDEAEQIITAFMEANTNAEVNEIVNANLDFLNENSELFVFARSARKRINNLFKVKMELTETIYKN